MATRFIDGRTGTSGMKAAGANSFAFQYNKSDGIVYIRDQNGTVRSISTSEATKHNAVNSTSDNTQVRINSRDFSTLGSGDSIGFQSKPRQAVGSTASVYGAQISPRFADAIAGGSIIGVEASPILQGTSGNLSGDWRAFDAILEDGGAGRTVAGIATALRIRSNFGSTVTGGAHVLHVLNEEGGTAWTSFAKFESGVAFVTDVSGDTSFPTNAGKLLVNVAGTLRAIALFENE